MCVLYKYIYYYTYIYIIQIYIYAIVGIMHIKPTLATLVEFIMLCDLIHQHYTYIPYIRFSWFGSAVDRSKLGLRSVSACSLK